MSAEKTNEHGRLARFAELCDSVAAVPEPWDEEDLPRPAPLSPALRKRLTEASLRRDGAKGKALGLAGAVFGVAVAAAAGYLLIARPRPWPVAAYGFRAERDSPGETLGGPRPGELSDAAGPDTDELSLRAEEALILRVPPKQPEAGEVEARVFIRRGGAVTRWEVSMQRDPATGTFRLYTPMKGSGFGPEQDLIIAVGRPQALPDLAAIRAGAEPSGPPSQQLWHKHTIHITISGPTTPTVQP